MQNFSDFIVKCAIFEEHSSSCVVYSRFSGTLFPVSMTDGEKYVVYLIASYRDVAVASHGSIQQYHAKSTAAFR